MMFEPHKAARTTDPATSKDAAQQARTFAGTQHGAILRVLKRGPASPEQIGARLRLDPYAIRKRLPELQREGLACPTGEVVPTIYGRMQRVWRLI